MAQYPPFRASGIVDAAGNLTLTYHGRGSQTVRVTQVTAEIPTAGGAICSCRLNGDLISPLVPTGGVAAGDPPVFMDPGDELTVEWIGAPVGAVGKMLVIYDQGGP